MATLYLIEQNTILRKSGDRLLLCRKPPVNRYSPGVRQDDILVEWPCSDIDHVMVFGNVQITTQTLHQLLEKGIETALFTLHGELLGQVTPPMGKNIFLRIRQFEKYQDNRFRIDFAQKLVYAKICNALHMLRAHAKNNPQILEERELTDLPAALEKINECRDPESLVGLEGSTAATYFKILSKLLPPVWKFAGRSKRPPKDPANAVLSFGYTLAASELASLLDGAGFDPCLGYFHEPDYGRPSLALDLMEPFRHPLVDRLMLTLFNLKILDQTDFTALPRGGTYLSESGKRKFIEHYEKMLGPYQDDLPQENDQPKYRAAFQQQVAHMAKCIKDEVSFAPFRLDEKKINKS